MERILLCEMVLMETKESENENDVKVYQETMDYLNECLLSLEFHLKEVSSHTLRLLFVDQVTTSKLFLNYLK